MAVGNDGNLGTSEGAGNAWKTIDKAMNEVAAGDKVWVKASVDYTELATIDTAGGAITPIIFEGYTSSTGDGGRAVITGGGARASCVVDGLGIDTSIYYVFKNFRFTNATAIGFTTDCDHITFKNCKFDTHVSHGLQCQLVVCEDCEFSSNGSSGANLTKNGAILLGCIFYGNGSHGFHGRDNYPVFVANSTFFSNAGGNIYVEVADKTLLVVLNCTIDGDGEDSDHGIKLQGATAHLSVVAIVNTVIYDCAVGIESSEDAGERVVSRNNCVNSNTADYVNFNTFTGEVTDAPNFVNEVGGADYTPDTDSPLIDAGFDAGS